MTVRSRLVVEPIGGLEQAGRLEPKWLDLWKTCSEATPFQSPAWLLPFWIHLGHAQEPYVLSCRVDGDLVAIAPLVRAVEGECMLFGGGVSDYLDILAASPFRIPVARAILDHLWTSGVRLCDLERLEAHSPLIEAAALQEGVEGLDDQDVCPFLPIAKGARDLADVVPIRFCKRVLQTRRRAERSGRLEVLWARASTVASHLETLFRLHGARWRVRGRPGVLADERIRAFHRSAANRLFRAGSLWLLQIRLDDEPVGALHALVGHGRVFYYASGFDPRFGSLSPGTLLIAELVSRAIALGYQEVDFLRGVEPYKYQWGARNRSTKRLRIACPEMDSSRANTRCPSG